MDELLKRFIDETDRKFDDFKEGMGQIHDKLDDLTKFKIEMMVSARLTSFLISIACGFITLVTCVAVAWYTARPPH